MYFWYKFFTYLLYPFAPIYLYLRIFKKKEDSRRYKEKLSKINIDRDKGVLVWIHVASVGEAMSVLPLIEECLKEKKIDKILITTITLSSGNILTKRYKENTKVIHQYLPLDINIFTYKFLDHWKPNLSIFIDSEIWPNLILNIKEKKIPLVLVNGRITKKSFSRWNLIKKFANKIFGKFDLCIVSNKESENFLKILGAKNVKNYGNLKFSNLKKENDKKFNSLFLDKIKDRKTWCAASTHANEEILCAKAHLKIKKYYSNILTIIIPRHIERAKKIREDLSNLKLQVIFSSNLDEMNMKTDVILIDSYGESLKFYNIVNNVFLGKSLVENLKKDSGQNPIEPARLGCTIFHGPNVSNFFETYQYLKRLNITHEVKNEEELSISLVEEFKNDRAKNLEIAGKIESYGQNILNNVIIELKKYI